MNLSVSHSPVSASSEWPGILVHSHTYYQLLWEEKTGILSFHWREDHSAMTYAEFQEACSVYAGYAFEYQARKLFVDTRNFQLSLPPEFAEWREKSHNPRFYKLGVEKMVYVVPAEYTAQAHQIPAQDGRFALRNVGTVEEAFAWLQA